MKNIKLTIITSTIILLLSSTFVIAQESDDCYSMNKNEYEKLSFKNYQDSYLKNLIEYYFTCDDTKPEPNNFLKFNPYFMNDSIIKLKTNNGYEIIMTSTKFQKKKHALQKNSKGYICRIDNKIFFGTDETEPLEEFKSIQVKLNNKTIGLDKKEYSDLYNPFFKYGNESRIYILQDKKNEYLLILMYASDGAGAYATMWIFKNGKYISRIVDFLC